MTRLEFFRMAPKARKLGLSLIDDVAWDNVVLGLSLAERASVITSLSKVISALSVGALDVALYELSFVTPIPTILEKSRIDAFTVKLLNLADSL